MTSKYAHKLNRRHCSLMAQIEELGSEGRVEEAQGMMKLVEQLKEERELLSSNPSVSRRASGAPPVVDLFNQPPV